MKIISLRACLDDSRGVNVAHAEAALEDGLFAQAHDNGAGRYYALTRDSWFAPRGGEDEADPVEEYSTSEDREAEEPDFLSLLRERARREDPYEDSDFAEIFRVTDRLLDDLLEGTEG